MRITFPMGKKNFLTANQSAILVALKKWGKKKTI